MVAAWMVAAVMDKMGIQEEALVSALKVVVVMNMVYMAVVVLARTVLGIVRN